LVNYLGEQKDWTRVEIPRKSAELVFKWSTSDKTFASWYKAVKGKSNTVLVVKTKAGRIWGGFTNLEWTDHKRWIHQNGASFCFRYTENGLEVFKHRTSHEVDQNHYEMFSLVQPSLLTDGHADAVLNGVW
jgi:hypothetical protein